MNPVEIFQRYAAACRALGVGRISAERIRELATAEDGIALATLQADIATLTSVTGDAKAALAVQLTAGDMLAGSWRGRSASTAIDLLERHCATAAGTVSALVGAADALDRLRARLHRLLEQRDEAGVRIAGRRSAERGWWLACSDAVLAGTADDAAVAEVTERIAPFVDFDVAGDWASSVTAVSDAVGAAYREAAAALAARPSAGFDVPSGAVIRPQVPTALAPPPEPLAAPAEHSAPAAPISALPSPIPAAAAGFPDWGQASTAATRLGGTVPDLPAGAVAGPDWENPSPDETPGRLRQAAAPAAGAESEPLSEPLPESLPESVPELESELDQAPDPGTDADTDAAEPDIDSEVDSEQSFRETPGPAASVIPDDTTSAPPVEAPAADPLLAESGDAQSGFAEPGSDESGSAERAPCEIAADALPQIGQ